MKLAQQLKKKQLKTGEANWRGNEMWNPFIHSYVHLFSKLGPSVCWGQGGWIRQCYTHISARGNRTQNQKCMASVAESSQCFSEGNAPVVQSSLCWWSSGTWCHCPGYLQGRDQLTPAPVLGSGLPSDWTVRDQKMTFYQLSLQKRQCAGSPEGEFQKRLAVKSGPPPRVENTKKGTGELVFLLEEEWNQREQQPFRNSGTLNQKQRAWATREPPANNEEKQWVLVTQKSFCLHTVTLLSKRRLGTRWRWKRSKKTWPVHEPEQRHGRGGKEEILWRGTWRLRPDRKDLGGSAVALVRVTGWMPVDLESR